MVVFNVRGTSGSGKTWVVRQILESAKDWYEFKNEKGKIKAYYSSQLNTVILGKYDNTCGGCDTLKGQDEVQNFVEYFVSKNANVVFEGLLISTIYKRWSDLSKNLKEKYNCDTIFCYLNTPIEQCVENVKNRRESAGRQKEFNPDNTVNRVYAINRTRLNLLKDKCYVYTGNPKEIRDLILKGVKHD